MIKLNEVRGFNEIELGSYHSLSREVFIQQKGHYDKLPLTFLKYNIPMSERGSE
jgi:hypothetical protein